MGVGEGGGRVLKVPSLTSYSCKLKGIQAIVVKRCDVPKIYCDHMTFFFYGNHIRRRFLHQIVVFSNLNTCC